MSFRHLRAFAFVSLFLAFALASFNYSAVSNESSLIEKAPQIVKAQLAESLSLTGVSQVHSKLNTTGTGTGILVIDDWGNTTSGAPHGESVLDVIRATAPGADVWLCKLDFALALMNDFTGCLLEMEERELPVDVVNMSFSMGDKFYKTSCGTELTEFGRTINRFAEQGIIFVAASGNQGEKNGLRFPACHNDVISVAATYDSGGSKMVFQSSEFTCRDDSDLDKITCYSNISSYLDLLAPGTMMSTPSNPRFGGTSAAAPVVSGVVALMLSQNAGMTKQQVVSTLRNTGKSIYDTNLRRSFSRVDAYAALESVVGSATNNQTRNQPAVGISVHEQSVASFDANQNAVIEDGEFFQAVESWIDQSITDQLFFSLIDAWTSKAVLATINERPKLQIQSTRNSLHFTRSTSGTRAALQIYDTNGKLISSQVNTGQTLRWNLQNSRGQRVANGIYFYTFSYELNGEMISETGKVSVLR